MPLQKQRFRCALILIGMMVAAIIGCTPSQLSEPEPLPDSIVRDLSTKENALWAAFQKKDKQRLGRFLSDDYVAVRNRGPMGKSAAIASVEDQNISEFAVRDLRATLLGSNYVLLTYRCRSKGEEHGNAFDFEYLCTDIWVSRGGAWQSIFFEDRPLADQSSAAAKY